MSLVSLNPINDGQDANSELFNARFAALANVLNGNVESINLADNAVSTSKIADNAVTTVKIPNNAITAAKIEVQQQWQNVTYLNGFIQYAPEWGQCQYYKDSLGIVRFRGLIKNGAVNTAMFNLPVGYRPSVTLLLVAMSNEAICRVDISTNGDVIARSGHSTNWLSLSPLTFRAEQ